MSLRSTSMPAILFADQAFLRDRSDQRAVARKNEAPGKAACAVRARAVLCVEEPFVGSERTMKPQRVVEARRLDRTLEHGGPCATSDASSSVMSEA